MCDELHQGICPASHRSRLETVNAPETLRVVDLDNNCLVDVPWSERYIAHSAMFLALLVRSSYSQSIYTNCAAMMAWRECETEF